jgi:hypothetical protein
LTDSAHFFNPALTASSMLVFDAALSSMIFATDMGISPQFRRAIRRSRQRRRPLVKQTAAQARC